MFKGFVSNLVGKHYTLPDNWMVLLKPESFMNRPIRYLEIGAHCGIHLLCVAASFAKHPDSELFGIDPWEDYNDYPEYKGVQMHHQEAFECNIAMFPNMKQKIKSFKGYSHEIIPTFDADFFDIIYIDGNHQPEYVLEDGVLAFRKVKPNGILIFDDYNFGGLDVTKRGVDAFLTAYRERIEYLGFYGGQIFCRKKE